MAFHDSITATTTGQVGAPPLPSGMEEGPLEREGNTNPQTSPPSSSAGIVFLAVNIALAAAITLFGSTRNDSRNQRPRLTPRTEPSVIAPRYNDPDVISDAQLQTVLHKLRPALRHASPDMNHIDHALRLWTPRAVFDDPDCFSGTELLGILTDHRQYLQHRGKPARPFLLANTNFSTPYVEIRTRAGADSASHTDHTLATLAESGTPLDYPLNTATGEFPLRAAFDFSFESFSINQAEPEWSALAFLHNLPPETTWKTREGQSITWDMIAARLMREKLARGSCYGTHRLHTLVCMLRVDEASNILTLASRAKIISYLQEVTKRLVVTQHHAGFWDADWPGDEWDGPSIPTSIQLDERSERILATGHTLEWWALAPEEVLPERKHIIAASQWLAATIDTLSPAEVSKAYTFLTHAVRALALWRGTLPVDAYIPVTHAPANASESEAHIELAPGDSP